MSRKAVARAMRMLIEAGQTPEQAEAVIAQRDITDETDLVALTSEIVTGGRVDLVAQAIERNRERAAAAPNPLLPRAS